MKNESLRKWATPVTTGAFALSAVTGILLFFHVQIGMVKVAHEWLSWIFVLGAIFHVILNRQVFMKYFSKPIARGIMIVFLVLICASLLPLGGGQRKSPVAKVTDSVVKSPLTEVAQISNRQPDEAVNALRARGISVDRTDQTIQDIAAQNHMNPVRVLDAIF